MTFFIVYGKVLIVNLYSCFLKHFIVNSEITINQSLTNYKFTINHWWLLWSIMKRWVGGNKWFELSTFGIYKYYKQISMSDNESGADVCPSFEHNLKQFETILPMNATHLFTHH